MTQSNIGSEELRGLSEELRRFVAEMPWERRAILAFARRAAAECRPGERVLDLGAGDAPFRELFAHADYLSADWAGSSHERAGEADIISPAWDLPLDERSIDRVLCTQLLEHVPEPLAVLRETARVLRSGGRLYLTVPLAWELHELPYDYFRFTAPGLEHLLHAAGLRQLTLEPRTDCFTTVAQLLTNLGHAMGRAPDGLDGRREEVAALLASLADQIAAFAPLDVRHIFPLGYQAIAEKPA